jgi:hypothetical protein
LYGNVSDRDLTSGDEQSLQSTVNPIERPSEFHRIQQKLIEEPNTISKKVRIPKLLK